MIWLSAAQPRPASRDQPSVVLHPSGWRSLPASDRGPDLDHRQFQRRHERPIAPALDIWIVGKQGQSLAGRGLALDRLAHHDDAPGRRPALRPVAQFGQFQSRLQRPPPARLVDRPPGQLHGNKVVDLLGFTGGQEVVVEEPAVGVSIPPPCRPNGAAWIRGIVECCWRRPALSGLSQTDTTMTWMVTLWLMESGMGCSFA